MSSSIMKTLQIRKPTSLPVSSIAAADEQPGLFRRRLSSLSLNLSRNQPSTATGDFPRSKSVSTMGEQGGSSVKEWWGWSWSWILLRRIPIFFTDLESKSSLEINKEAASLRSSSNSDLRSAASSVLPPTLSLSPADTDSDDVAVLVVEWFSFGVLALLGSHFL